MASVQVRATALLRMVRMRVARIGQGDNFQQDSRIPRSPGDDARDFVVEQDLRQPVGMCDASARRLEADQTRVRGRAADGAASVGGERER